MKVSVIIPIYNAESYLERCLDSVCRQTYTDLEIIAVNDCTPDCSMDIVEQFAKKDSRIRVVENPCNMGAMVARNKGCEVALGDMFCFLDSDDYLVPDAIECLMARYEETGADIISAGLVLHVADDKEMFYRSTLPYGCTLEGVHHAILNNLFPSSLCAKLYVRRLFANGGFSIYEDMSISEDVSLLHQLVEHANQVAVVDSIIYHCEDNPTSSTHLRYGVKQLESILMANDIKLEICGKYTSLQKDLDKVVTFVLLRLFAHDVPFKVVGQMIKAHCQERYASLWHAFKVLTPRRFWGTLAVIALNKMRFFFGK